MVRFYVQAPNKGDGMSIKSSSFGSVELSGVSAERFRKHLDDIPNPIVKKALANGREILKKILQKENT